MCMICPDEAENNRTHFVVGGDCINYLGEVTTPNTGAKLLFNSAVSTKGARFMTTDISNFYLMMPPKRPEYIRINLHDTPKEIIKEYNLKDKANKDGAV